VFVTGANGFLGATLTELLLRRGYRVLAGHRPRAKLHLLEEVRQRTLGDDRSDWHSRLRLIPADINDRASLETAVPDGVSVVFHVAASVSFERVTEAQRRMVYRANVVGTRNVAAVCRAKGAGRLVHVSTEGVYFARDRLGVVNELSEKAAARTGVGYLHTKLLAEHEVLRAVVQDGLWAAIVQPAAIVGR
jgi:nucleoside-diphosphate-sugar epimerase